MDSNTIITICLHSLIIGHTFLILFIVLLVALFYYSTPYSRRQPVFILNVFAIVLASIAGAGNDAVNICMMLSSYNISSTKLQIAIEFIGVFQWMLVDTILLVRLITVHPLSHIGFRRFALLTSLPMALKVARTVNIILYTNQLNILANDQNAFQSIYYAFFTLPYLKIEWIAQVADNSYASIAFLWSIRKFGTNATSAGLANVVTSPSLAKRIRILFNFALSNFIIPTLLSIIQLALLFRIDDVNPILVSDIAMVNAGISIFGVVFSTVWAGKEHRRKARISPRLFPVERRQGVSHALGSSPQHPPVDIVNIDIENGQSDHASSESAKDVDVCNQDDDLVKGRDIALCEPRLAM